MTRIEISETDLIVYIEGWDRFFAFKNELRVPLTHVAGAEHADDEARGWFHGFRAPGTEMPGVITAGTFYHLDGGRVFWDVHDANGAIAILLHDESYTKLIVEVADPVATIAAIEAALPHP